MSSFRGEGREKARRKRAMSLGIRGLMRVVVHQRFVVLSVLGTVGSTSPVPRLGRIGWAKRDSWESREVNGGARA